MAYSCEIHFKNYERTSPTLQDSQNIYVNGQCVIAKNAKYGGFYRGKKVTFIKGMFLHGAGSHSYPALIPRGKEVVIYCNGFEQEPKLTNWDEFDFKHKTHITLTNIKQHANGTK